MKKILITIMGLFMIVMLSNSANATDVITSTGGAAVVVADAAGNGSGFTFTPSPGTIMDVGSLETAFSLLSTSVKTTGTDGMIYGLVSTNSLIYQVNQVEATEGTFGSIAISATDAGSGMDNLTAR